MSDLEKKLDKIEAARVGILDTFMELMEHRILPNEALTCLAELLIQIYVEMVTDKSKENFVAIMDQCFDAYELTSSTEGLGSIQ